MKYAKYRDNAAHYSNYSDCVEYVKSALEMCHEDPEQYDIDGIIENVYDFVDDPSTFIGWQEKDMEENEFWEVCVDFLIEE